jgi:hydroxypyruvate isomerase
MPRFAANLNWLFTEHPFLERFAAARAAGFRAVEFPAPYPHPPEEIAERLRANGQQCVLFNLPMGDKSRGDFGIACRPGREGEFREGVALGIEYAKHLRPPHVNCISGTIAAGEDAKLLTETLVSNLRFAAREFKKAGLELVIEPINNRDTPGFFVPRSPQAAEIIRQVGEDNVGLQFDLYHTAMMGDDCAALLETLLPVIRHIQFADAPGRGEPGSGTVDLPRLFDKIDRLGYPGWVSAEYRPSKPTVETLHWMPRAG